MRAKYPKLRILAGVEANIRSNGEVDVPEDELARARLGRRVGAQRAARTGRPSACSRRWTTRTSTASGI